MKISHEFTVSRPTQAVWDFFQNVPDVAQCLPGAEVTSNEGDGKYAGKVAVKLGPMSAGWVCPPRLLSTRDAAV